jgi:hypothetical protein
MALKYIKFKKDGYMEANIFTTILKKCRLKLFIKAPGGFHSPPLGNRTCFLFTSGKWLLAIPVPALSKNIE